nr:MAG TPA: hypothetical protein [Caudoviricetes sp.]
MSQVPFFSNTDTSYFFVFIFFPLSCYRLQPII